MSEVPFIWLNYLYFLGTENIFLFKIFVLSLGVGAPLPFPPRVTITFYVYLKTLDYFHIPGDVPKLDKWKIKMMMMMMMKFCILVQERRMMLV